jgi:hypothetical protein
MLKSNAQKTTLFVSEKDGRKNYFLTNNSPNNNNKYNNDWYRSFLLALLLSASVEREVKEWKE